VTSTASPPDSHHDTLFRYAFSRAELAEGELRSVLPRAVLDALDFGTLRVEPGTLVDAEHAALETDLLYRVELSGHPAFVFILFEHQSQPDPRMPWRMLRYMVRIWDRFLRDESDTKANLPLIIPLVLHNGLRPWNAARSLRQLYEAPEPLLDALGPHLLDLTLRIDDLPALDPAAIRERHALDALGKLVLLAMQRARIATDIVSEIATWLDLARTVVDSPQGLEDFRVVIRYLHFTADFEPEALRAAIRQGLGKKKEEQIMTAAERLLAKGRAEGEAKGEARGKAEGRREIVLKVLTLRFGALPSEVEAQVRHGSNEDLERWTEQALSSSSLEDALR